MCEAPASPIVIKRAYNNNVVLAVEPNGVEVILLGRSIGYAKKPGAIVDRAQIEHRFLPDHDARVDRVTGLLTDTPLEHVTLGRQIVDLAAQRLKLTVTQSMVLSVIDHLTFAIRRATRGITVEFPLRWEVTQLYPQEVAAAREAVELVNATVGVALQRDEATAFALHFVNAQLASPDIGTAIKMTEMIGQTFDLIDRAWGCRVDQESMSAARFVTHLRYLFARLERGRQIVDSPEPLLDVICAAHPEAVIVAGQIKQLLEDELEWQVNRDELAYITLHVSRLSADLSATGATRRG